MEPKYLTKTDDQLNPNTSRIIKNKKDSVKSTRRMNVYWFSDVLCLQQISTEKLELCHEFWVFSLFCEV